MAPPRDRQTLGRRELAPLGSPLSLLVGALRVATGGAKTCAQPVPQRSICGAETHLQVGPELTRRAKQLKEPPPPRDSDFLPAPPSGLSALAPGRKRAHAAAAAEAQAAYARALAEHAQAERRRQELLARAHAGYEQAIAREKERIRRQHAVIDRLAGDFAAGRRKAVADYFREVLARQRYPSDFPTGVKIAYLPAEQELVTDIDLPLLEAVPEMMSCEYLVTKKTLRHKALSAPARNSLYQLIIAQMALRTVRAVFAADRGSLTRSVACN